MRSRFSSDEGEACGAASNDWRRFVSCQAKCELVLQDLPAHHARHIGASLSLLYYFSSILQEEIFQIELGLNTALLFWFGRSGDRARLRLRFRLGFARNDFQLCQDLNHDFG